MGKCNIIYLYRIYEKEMINMVLCDNIAVLDNYVDFLRIYEGRRHYYGGTQEWFKSSELRHTGCSIVAAANIAAYISLMSKKKSLYNYDDMSKDNFLHLMEEIALFIHPDAVKGVTSVTYFDDKVRRFSRDKGVLLKSYAITTEDYFINVKDFIKTALSQNKPVALLMLENSILKEFDWHWMTITKLFENVDKTYVDISTWGERRIFTLEDFYKYSSFGALSYFDAVNI